MAPRLAKSGNTLLRHARWRGRARVAEAQLARAARAGSPIIFGPCLQEIGFELLYWIPFLRRLSERHALDPEQITVISRGGVRAWYADLASDYVDVLDLFDADDYGARLSARRAQAGDRKQLALEQFDREILARMRGAQRPAVVHPALMFLRLRYYWTGQRSDALLERRASYRLLDRAAVLAHPLPDAVPAQYTVFKAYFSDCFPDTPANRAALTDRIEGLTAQGDVVVLNAPATLDDHADWLPAAHERIHHASRWLTPADNLAVQSALIARARSLHCTYGGFASLAPLLGVEAHTFYSVANFNPVHLGVVQRVAAISGAPFTVAEIAAPDLCAQ